MQEKGNISIHTENIFPIIKKWLYSEKDIFLRELVSNASDAISKHKKLVSLGDASADESETYEIKVVVDKEEKTISIIDNGIGMTADEVKKYINQIAFSGAEDFIKKYDDKSQDSQIIGHFGLGFYSAFMVSQYVTIDTLSWQDGVEAVQWKGDGGTEYSIESSQWDKRGSKITLHIADDCTEYLSKFEVKNVLKKYFQFLPIEIFVEEVNEEPEKDKDGNEIIESALNDINPLWVKNPRECTEEEYKSFYNKVFLDFNEPLFWVHLNLDYPFNLKGILYFPKLKHEYETIEGQIKLYNNQVFVADNVKEVIPEFLMLLKGCIDCPDLPLNVSRSFLQNDGSIKTLSSHITKKVSDKLNSLFKTEYENYCKYWDDINPFVKYGCLKDDKFYENVKDTLIFKTINDDYSTVKEYIENLDASKEEKTVYYVDDMKAQGQYVAMFKENNINAVLLNGLLDTHFITFLESKETGIRFKRIDSDVSDALKGEDAQLISEEDIKKVEEYVKNHLEENKNLKVEVKPLKDNEVPALLQQSEESRRMAELSKMYGGGMNYGEMFPSEEILVLNSNNILVKRLNELNGNDDEKGKTISEHLYDLAVIGSRPLDAESLKRFIDRNVKLLSGF